MLIPDRLNVCCAALLALLPPLAARADGFRVLYTFQGGADGGDPADGLAEDKSGNIFGTTQIGGVQSCGTRGCGVLFEINAEGQESALYAFTGFSDGAYPRGAPLVSRDQTAVWGTTFQGGSHCLPSGCGTVFEISVDGRRNRFLSLAKKLEGDRPCGALIGGVDFGLYGTTVGGGAEHGGTVFKIGRNDEVTIVHGFSKKDDGGRSPQAGLVRDKQGNLYGTTSTGGAFSQGTVFKIAPDNSFSVLHAFSGGMSDGATPLTPLIVDAQGNLYGTTPAGVQYGVAFKIAPDGTETLLHVFGGDGDGAVPLGALVEDKDGNFYGTTQAGGAFGFGVLYKIAPDGTETVLHSFSGGSDGANPLGGLIFNHRHSLIGTTSSGGPDLSLCFGDGCGTVFEYDL